MNANDCSVEVGLFIGGLEIVRGWYYYAFLENHHAGTDQKDGIRADCDALHDRSRGGGSGCEQGGAGERAGDRGEVWGAAGAANEYFEETGRGACAGESAGGQGRICVSRGPEEAFAGAAD